MAKGIEGLNEALNLALTTAQKATPMATPSALPKTGVDTSTWEEAPVDTSNRKETKPTNPASNIVGGLMKSATDIPSLITRATKKVFDATDKYVVNPLSRMLGAKESTIQSNQAFADKARKDVIGGVDNLDTALTNADRDSTEYKVAKGVGDIAQTFIPTGEAGLLAKGVSKIPKAGKIVKGLIKDTAQYAVDTVKYEALANQELPTKGEFVTNIVGGHIVGPIVRGIGNKIGGKTAKVVNRGVTPPVEEAGFKQPPKGVFEKTKMYITDLISRDDPVNNLTRVFKTPNGGTNKLVKNSKYIDNKATMFSAVKDDLLKGDVGVNFDGDFFPGKHPDSVNETVDVLVQSLQKRGQAINKMVQQTDGKGILLNVDNAVNNTLAKLDELYNSKVITRKSDYDAMRNIVEEFKGNGTITFEQGQNMIASLNKELESAYTKSQHTASQDALLEFASSLRKELDNGIDSLQGSSFQQVKSEYGAIKASLEEAMHYYNINNQKAPIGLMEGLGYITDPVGGVKRIIGSAITDANSRDNAARQLWKMVMKKTDLKKVFPKAKGQGYQGK